MISIGELKRGDSFRYSISLTDPSGTPTPRTIEDLKAELRTPSETLVAVLDIFDGENPGEFFLESQDTSKWPLGDLYFDLQVTDAGSVSSTDTIKVVLVKDVTSNG